jgi:hypothetical protein
MLYALFQKNLNQTIDHKVLEHASVHVPSVARGDCARLARELFGIVVDKLPYEEAVAFQIALAHFGHETDLVSHDQIPTLPDPVRRRGIRFAGPSFTAIDGMGREQHFPWTEVQFAAGGFVDVLKYVHKERLEFDHSGRGTMHGMPLPRLELTRGDEPKRENEFRLELFLSCPPFRLQFPAHRESMLRVDETILRFHQQSLFDDLLVRVARLFDPSCLNQGLHAALRNERMVYPSLRAWDEELTWHLHRSVRMG